MPPRRGTPIQSGIRGRGKRAVSAVVKDGGADTALGVRLGTPVTSQASHGSAENVDSPSSPTNSLSLPSYRPGSPLPSRIPPSHDSLRLQTGLQRPSTAQHLKSGQTANPGPPVIKGTSASTSIQPPKRARAPQFPLGRDRMTRSKAEKIAGPSLHPERYTTPDADSSTEASLPSLSPRPRVSQPPSHSTSDPFQEGTTSIPRQAKTTSRSYSLTNVPRATKKYESQLLLDADPAPSPLQHDYAYGKQSPSSRLYLDKEHGHDDQARDIQSRVERMAIGRGTAGSRGDWGRRGSRGRQPSAQRGQEHPEASQGEVDEGAMVEEREQTPAEDDMSFQTAQTTNDPSSSSNVMASSPSRSIIDESHQGQHSPSPSISIGSEVDVGSTESEDEDEADDAEPAAFGAIIERKRLRLSTLLNTSPHLYIVLAPVDACSKCRKYNFPCLILLASKKRKCEGCDHARCSLEWKSASTKVRGKKGAQSSRVVGPGWEQGMRLLPMEGGTGNHAGIIGHQLFEQRAERLRGILGDGRSDERQDIGGEMARSKSRTIVDMLNALQTGIEGKTRV